jgi:hypothetical protein
MWIVSMCLLNTRIRLLNLFSICHLIYIVGVLHLIDRTQPTKLLILPKLDLFEQ